LVDVLGLSLPAVKTERNGYRNAGCASIVSWPTYFENSSFSKLQLNLSLPPAFTSFTAGHLHRLKKKSQHKNKIQ
jgi:hypothetical protein